MPKQEPQPNELLKCYRSECYVIAVETPSHRSKVFQILFGKKDGSLFVNFPYYEHSNGVVSLMTWTPENLPPTDLSLDNGGKITSHLVKYSHHPNGQTHFSQDGKVFTKVKKQSEPINNVEGHEFTIQLQGLSSFKKLEDGIKLHSTKRRATLKFTFIGEPEAIKFVGYWYSQEAISKRLAGHIGERCFINDHNGKSHVAFIISAPLGHAAEKRVLALYCEVIPRLDMNNETALTFIGGFDSDEIVNDLTRTTSFLALLYPVMNPNELIAKIGSIDFRR